MPTYQTITTPICKYTFDESIEPADSYARSDNEQVRSNTTVHRSQMMILKSIYKVILNDLKCGPVDQSLAGPPAICTGVGLRDNPRRSDGLKHKV